MTKLSIDLFPSFHCEQMVYDNKNILEASSEDIQHKYYYFLFLKITYILNNFL